MAWKSMSMGSLETTLGTGGFGRVLLVRKHLDNQLYAVKVIENLQGDYGMSDQDRQFITEKLEDEIFLLMAMNHRNITRIFGYFKEDDKRHLVMEYCESDMEREIRTAQHEKRLLAESDIYHWTRQLASAVCYLHKTNIRHDDIKPSNVLLKCEAINNQTYKTVRLTDFGISGENNPLIANFSDSTSSGDLLVIGTVAYMSPDLIAHRVSCFKRDVWAFGATVYEMATCERLFSNINVEREVASFKSLINDRGEEVGALKPELVGFLNLILNPDRNERPSMDLVMEHRFLDDLPRLFVSYSWSNKETVIKVTNRLLRWNFSVWIDDQNMYGNLTDGMAEAIEQATVVLLCFSSDYAQSRNCKAEADYVFRLGKPFVPLKMQRDYSPNGWLGMVIGNALYYDFSESELFDKSFDKLVDALRHIGRFPNNNGSRAFLKKQDQAVQTMDDDDNLSTMTNEVQLNSTELMADVMGSAEEAANIESETTQELLRRITVARDPIQTKAGYTELF